MIAQDNENLRRLWELTAVERIEPVMFGCGRRNSNDRFAASYKDNFLEMVYSMTYNVVGDEIELFDRDMRSLPTGVGWKIEQLTSDELYLLIIAKPEQKAIIRFKY